MVEDLQNNLKNLKMSTWLLITNQRPVDYKGERAIFDKARYCNGFPKLVAISFA